MKNDNSPNWKVVVFGIIVIALLALGTYLAANYLSQEEDVSPEDTSAYDVEPVIKTYQYDEIYTFSYDSSVWDFLAEDDDLGSKFENLDNGGVLTISVQDSDKTLDELYVQEKNSISNISTELAYIEEKQIQKGGRVYYKVVFESKLLGNDSVVRQARVLTLADDKLVKLVYILPDGGEDLSEIDGVISSLVIN